VEIHVSGDPEDLSALEERLHQGPRAARVEGVEEIEPREELPSDFRVVY
jgi:acylphosphatase